MQATLRGYLEELALIADGWYRRVTLAWPYAGGHVEVVGEAGEWVGGWVYAAGGGGERPLWAAGRRPGLVLLAC